MSGDPKKPWRPTSSVEWVGVLRKASDALRTNPDDEEARTVVNAARGQLSPRVLAAFDREHQGQLRDLQEAQPGRAATAAVEYGRAASFGLTDELAGGLSAAAALVPGGESPRQAYLRSRDQQRAYQDAARAANPGTAFAGNMAGTIVNPVSLIASSLPVVRATIAAGAAPAATLAAKIGGALMGGAVTGTQAGLTTYGEGEQGPIADLADVPLNTAIGTALGAGGTAVGSNIARRASLRQLEAQTTVANAQRAPVELEAARLRLDQARRLAPLRTRAAEQGVDLRQARIEAVPDQTALRQGRVARSPAQTTSAEGLATRQPDLIEQASLRTEAMRRAAAEAAPDVSPSGVDRAMLRRQGFTDEQIADVEVQRAPRMQPRAAPDAARSVGVEAAPQPTPTAAPVGEAQLPGQALHDVQGNPIPGSEVRTPYASPEVMERVQRSPSAQWLADRNAKLGLRTSVESMDPVDAIVQTPFTPATQRDVGKMLTQLRDSGPDGLAQLNAIRDQMAGRSPQWSRFLDRLFVTSGGYPRRLL